MSEAVFESGLQSTIGKDPAGIVGLLRGLIQDGARSFALLDKDLKVVFANERMRVLLGRDVVDGLHFPDCFPHDQDRVVDLCKRTTQKDLIRLIFRHPQEMKDRRVTCEFGRIDTSEQTFSFVLMAETSQFHDEDFAALENADFGVLRMDAADPTRIIFANQKAARILDYSCEELCSGKHDLTDLALEGADRKRISRYLTGDDSRKTGRLDLLLPRKGRQALPLTVYAFPQMDTVARGRTGYTMMLFPTESSDLRQNLHRLTEQFRSKPHKMAKEGITAIGHMIPHKFAVVTLYESLEDADEGIHKDWCWPAHIEPQPPKPWSTQWFQLSPLMVQHMSSLPDDYQGEHKEDLEAELANFPDNEALRKDEVTQGLLKDGYVSIMTFPARDSQNNWLASLTLFRKRGDNFLDAEFNDAVQAGVPTFVSSLLASFSERERKVMSDVREEIGSAKTFSEAMEVITDQLCRFFRWQHMSVFRCDYAAEKFRLVEQGAYKYKSDPADLLRLPSDYTQSFGDGLLGKCHADGAEMVINDTEDGSPLTKWFKRVHKDTRAELCMPICARGLLSKRAHKTIDRPVYLLNAEDRRRSSFPEPTLRKMRDFANTIEISLASRQRRAILEKLQEEVGSGIILTDASGLIWGANQKLLQMLGRDALPEDLDEVFTASADRAMAMNGAGSQEFRVALRRQDGKEFSAWLTASNFASFSATDALDEIFDKDHIMNLRLVYLSDLSKVDFKNRMSGLKELASGIAGDLKVPLASAFGNLDRLRNDIIKRMPASETNKSQLEARLERIEEVLAELDVDFDQLIDRETQRVQTPQARYEDALDLSRQHEEEATDLVSLFKEVVSETSQRFRRADSPVIDAEITSEGIQVRVKAAHLETLMRRFIEFVVQQRNPSDPISARLYVEDDVAWIDVAGKLRKASSVNKLDSFDVAVTDARKVTETNPTNLRRAVTAMQGELEWEEGQANGNTRICLKLPLAKGHATRGEGSKWS